MREGSMRSWKKMLLAAAAAVGLTGMTGTVYADSLHLGSNSANIMNDGIIAEAADGTMYYANTLDGGRLYMERDGASRRISERAGHDINVVGSDVYFVADQSCRILCLEDGQREKVIYTSDTPIEEMYVAEDGRIWFLTEGNVYLLPADSEEETAPVQTTEVPAAETAVTEAETAPETEDPETEVPSRTEEGSPEAVETSGEETSLPETEASETETSETEAPETEAAGTEVSEAELSEAEAELVWDADRDILHFIPTCHGVIYAVGSPWNYTLYAEGQEIRSGVAAFYEMEGTLYALAGGSDYTADLGSVFHGTASSALREVVYEPALSASLIGEEQVEECEECEANAEHARGDASEAGDWAAAESVYGALLEGEELSSSTATSTHSILNDSSVSNGQRNMVRRAYQMHLVEWVPKADIYGWNKEYTYTKGKTYRGLPYGQPVNVGGYVPWSHSLDKFVGYVDDINSNMYKSYSEYNKIAPYYSTDCSGFVSWAWQTSGRLYTRVFANYSTQVSKQSIYSVQIGDAFCKAGSHVVMVSDIGVNSSGTIVYIDIIEETPPITKLTRYGEGGSKTLQQMSDKYLGNGYVLLRSTTRDKVTYTPSAVVVLEDESAGTIHMNSTGVLLDVGESYKLTYKTDFTSSLTPDWSSSNTTVAKVASDGTVTALATGQTTVTLKIGVSKASVTVSVAPQKVVLASAVNLSEGGIKVSWNKVTGAGYYLVYRKNVGGTWTRIAKVTTLTYTDAAALEPAARYTYTVRAGIQFADGSTATGLYDSTGVSVKTPPAAPVMKAVTAASISSQTITWNKVEGAEGYYLYMKSGSGDYAKIADVTGTSYTKSGLTCGTGYTYAAKAYFKEGTTAVLGKLSEEAITKTCCPAQPKLKALTVVDSHSQKIEWEAVDGASGYLLYQKTSLDSSWARVCFTADTTHLNAELTPGVTYTYTVRAYRTVNSKNIYSDYDKKGLSSLCRAPAPALGTVSSTGYKEQTVTWKALEAVDGYAVYIKEPGSDAWTRKATVTDTSARITGLTLGRTYSYTVRAFNTVNKTEVYGLYDKTGISGQCLPEAPKLGKVSSDTLTSLKVTWEAVKDAAGYVVYRRPAAGGSWTKILTTTALSCVSSGLEPGRKYNYTVKSYIKVDGKSVYSLYDKTGITGTCAPPAPVLKSVTAAGTKSLKITWDAMTGVDGYRIYLKNAAGEWKFIGSSDTNSFLHEGLTVGASYTYTVRAFVNVGEDAVGGYYNRTGITGKCAPAKVVLESASAVAPGSIRVTWKAVEGAQAYRVYRKVSGSWKYLATTKELSYTENGLQNGTDTCYTVRAEASAGSSVVCGSYDSKGVHTKVVPARVPLKTLTSSAAGQIRLAWDAVPAVGGYRVYYKTASTGWKRVGDVTGTSAVLEGFKSGETYWFTVRGFWTVSGTSYYGYYDTTGLKVTVM